MNDHAEDAREILSNFQQKAKKEGSAKLSFLKIVHSWGGVTEMVHGLFLLVL